MQVLSECEVIQLIEGTDDLSLARVLALGLLETLTSAAHSLSFGLFEGSSSSAELLSEIKEHVSRVRHNMSIIYGFASDFDTFAENVKEAGHE